MSNKPNMYGENASRFALGHLSKAQFVTPLTGLGTGAEAIQGMDDAGHGFEAKNNADSMWRSMPTTLSRLDNVSDPDVRSKHMGPFLHTGEESGRRS